MDALKRENRVLRVAIVVLVCGVAATTAMRGQDQGQRLPGPGTGVVPVKVTDEAIGVVQHGEWRVKVADEAIGVMQHGDWRVGVHGGVETAPVMPPLLVVNRTYLIHWDHVNADTVTLRELHPSGWGRVDGGGGERWVNLTRAVSIARR